MDKLIVTASGIGLIAGIYWFFFGKKSGEAGSGSAREPDGSISIVVSGGYSPRSLHLSLKKKTILVFIRKDPNPCLEELLIPDFKIKKYLPMHTPVTVTLSPSRPGIYDFHCGMNMFHGSIQVT
jgi:plastocyanin domain-containing protein